MVYSGVRLGVIGIVYVFVIVVPIPETKLIYHRKSLQRSYIYVNSRSFLQENEYKVLELSFLFLQDRVQHLFIPRRFFLYDCIFIIYSLVLIIENRGLKTVKKKTFLINTMNVQFYLFSRRNIDKFLQSLFVKSWYMNTMVLHVCQQK